jgi:HPt (histidine-containing phosphotransfer) domain-containing protein
VVTELLKTASSKARNLLAHLLPQTERELGVALGELGAATERRDRDGVERAAHQIAGLAGVIGAMHVAGTARSLMERAHDDAFRFAWARRQHAALVDGWERAQVALKSIAEPSTADAAVTSMKHKRHKRE